MSIPALAHARNRHDEAGGSLVLALVFLVVVSLIALGLANSVGGGLINSVNFRAARSVQSAANSAAELAVESLRYNFTPSTLNSSAPCWGGSSQLTINAQTVDAWCSTRWNPVSTGTRVVTIDICPSTFTTATACSASPLLLAVATFDDFPASGGPVSTAQCTTTTCGIDMAINSWVYGAEPPTVASVANGTTACLSGAAMKVNGTGFIAGATSVNFLVNSANNVVLAATQVNVVDSTMLTACSPSGTGSNVAVTVTTPVGTSATGASGPFFSY